MFLSLNSWNSNNDIFLNIFPSQNLRNANYYEFWYLIETKAWVFCIFSFS